HAVTPLASLVTPKSFAAYRSPVLSSRTRSVTGRSNGRAVLRSTNAGEKFTDMTWDATTDPAPAGSCCDPTPYAPNGIHPDQHALVVNPNNTGMFFEASDGGVVRSSGRFTDISSQCDLRPLSAPSLVACHNLLSSVPSHLYS